MESRKCWDYYKVKLELLKSDLDRCIEENTRLRQKLFTVTAQQKRQSAKLAKVSATLDEYISLTPLLQAQQTSTAAAKVPEDTAVSPSEVTTPRSRLGQSDSELVSLLL